MVLHQKSQIIHVPSSESGSTKIYLYGGYYFNRVSNQYQLNNRLYVYDLKAQSWSMHQSSGIGIYSGAVVYHEETRSLYYSGGKKEGSENRIQRYSLDSNNWYHIGSSPEYVLNSTSLLNMTHFQTDIEIRSESTAIIIDDRIYNFGGMTIDDARLFPAEDNVCVSPYAQVFDLACEKWTQVLPSESLARSSHGMIRRNDTLWVFGGNSGAKLENTVISIPILSITVPSSSQEEQTLCKAENWCAQGTYNCNDCNQKSYCTSCAGGCVLTDSLEGAMCEAIDVCPEAQEIKLNTTTVGTIWPGNGHRMTYTLRMDVLDDDVAIKVFSDYEGDLQLLLYSNKFYRKATGRNPQIKLGGWEADRHLGPYTIAVSTVSSSYMFPVEFTIRTTSNKWITNPADPRTIDPSPSIISTFDALQFMTVFTVCILFWLTISLVAKRIRDRLSLQRVVNSQLDYMSRIKTASFYEVKIGGDGWIVGNGRARSRFIRKTSMRDSALLYINSGINGLLCNLGVSSEPGSTYELQNMAGKSEETQLDVSTSRQKGLMGRIKEKVTPLKTQSSKEIIEMNSQSTNILKTVPMTNVTLPLSIEKIPSHPSQKLPSFVAIHYAVVFPDAAKYLEAGLIPPMSIGTVLYVDNDKHDVIRVDD